MFFFKKIQTGRSSRRATTAWTCCTAEQCMQPQRPGAGAETLSHMDGRLSRTASTTPGTTTRRAGAALRGANLRRNNSACSRGNEAQRCGRKRDDGEQVPLVLLRVAEQLVPSRGSRGLCKEDNNKGGSTLGVPGSGRVQRFAHMAGPLSRAATCRVGAAVYGASLSRQAKVGVWGTNKARVQESRLALIRAATSYMLAGC